MEKDLEVEELLKLGKKIKADKPEKIKIFKNKLKELNEEELRKNEEGI